ncbi:MAG: hypothetical protein J6U00_05060 [Ruminococcus sp.]|nr:hypothetical protein [Ruminococcus sp.]
MSHKIGKKCDIITAVKKALYADTSSRQALIDEREKQTKMKNAFGRGYC